MLFFQYFDISVNLTTIKNMRISKYVTLSAFTAAALLTLVGCSSATPSETTSPLASAGTPSVSASAAQNSSTSTKMLLETNKGPIAIALNPKAPKTLESFTSLSAQKYFDDTSCHRLTTEGIYVIQCGDPTGTGTGGPDYTIPDENLPTGTSNNYPAGTVAMANSGPGTNGSQFFIVYKNSTLPPNYTIWGTVTEGMETIEKIAAAGTTDGSSDGPLKDPLIIKSTTVS